MQKEKENNLLLKEEKKYQKPTMVLLGKLSEETKSSAIGFGNDDGGSGSAAFTVGG